MADYYTDVSFEVEMTPAEIEFALCLKELINDYEGDEIQDAIANGELDPPEVSFLIEALISFRDGNDYNIGCKVEPVNSPAIWIHSDEDVDIDSLICFLDEIMRAFDWPENKAIAFEWANTCNKPRLDAYGGGAIVMWNGGFKSMNTAQWVDKMVKDHGKSQV